ncbi:hypothetical protein EJ110_NYTH19663 [Nymphaea thermarum]|nr:hypothetical protein EJ110_NYTH19663 [Nymphaea thermarum]
MADSSSSSSVNTNLPDATSARSDHVPVQVATVQLNRENYSRWSPPITMGIAGRGRIAYVNGRKVEPAKDNVYSRVEAEEQRRLLSSGRKGEEQSAYVSRAPVGTPRSSRKCTHCKKVGHTRDFCWDLHPEKKDSRGRPSSGKKLISSATSDGKGSISAKQIRELRAHLSKFDIGQIVSNYDSLLEAPHDDLPEEVTQSLSYGRKDVRSFTPQACSFKIGHHGIAIEKLKRSWWKRVWMSGVDSLVHSEADWVLSWPGLTAAANRTEHPAYSV